MQQDPATKKSNGIVIIAIILFIIILLGAGGLFWLYRVERLLADDYKNQTGKTVSTLLETSNSDGSSESWMAGFYERIKSLYGNSSNNSSNTKDKTNTGSTSNTPTSNGNVSSPTQGAGPLDTDVPWREEGEPDPDYSYKEVRACGATIKGPPEISDNPEQFNQEYQEYLAWIDQDCKDAYAEAGKPYPF